MLYSGYHVILGQSFLGCGKALMSTFAGSDFYESGDSFGRLLKWTQQFYQEVVTVQQEPQTGHATMDPTKVRNSSCCYKTTA